MIKYTAVVLYFRSVGFSCALLESTRRMDGFQKYTAKMNLFTQ